MLLKKNTKILWVLFLILCQTVSYAQAPSPQFSQKRALRQADSLYELGKTGQALRIYRRLFEKERVISPKMLLRLSQSAESKSSYAEALIYLQSCYVIEPDRGLAVHMQEIASLAELKGYETSYLEWLSLYLRKHQIAVFASLVSAGLLFLLLIAALKWNRRPLGALPTLFVLFCVLSALILNRGELYQKAIVATPSALVFSGASPASDCAGLIEKGTRLTIIGQSDIWYHVSFDGKDGYIHQANLFIPSRLF